MYAISAGHEKTAEAAEMILRAGGNAFDAAVALTFAISDSQPLFWGRNDVPLLCHVIWRELVAAFFPLTFGAIVALHIH